MSQVYHHLSDENAVFILGFVGGFYDTAGYLKLRGIFTSSITGNLVAACSSVTTSGGTLTRSLVVASFFFAGAIGAWTILRLKLVNEFNTRQATLTIFSLDLVLMIAVWTIGLIYDDDIDHANMDDSWQLTLVACMMGAAMGFHNIAAKESIPNCPPTTVMTSTLIVVSTNFSNTIGYFLAHKNILSLSPYRPINNDISIETDLIRTRRKHIEDKYMESRGKLITTAKPLIAFVIGALIGAVVTEYASFWFSAVTVFFMLLIMYDIVSKEISERKISSASSLSDTVVNSQNSMKPDAEMKSIVTGL